MGFEHEHQRMDALGTHIKLVEGNIRESALPNFFLDIDTDPVHTWATPYDYGSVPSPSLPFPPLPFPPPTAGHAQVMHYSARAFAKDPK